jgi:hypothetical protein
METKNLDNVDNGAKQFSFLGYDFLTAEDPLYEYEDLIVKQVDDEIQSLEFQLSDIKT